MRTTLALSALILMLVAACAQMPARAEVTVFAASSLTDAFTEIAETFERANPGVEVLLNFGASSTLATQLVEGAPADVYASANQAQMRIVQDAGLIDGQPIIFTGNRLIIIVPSDNPAGIEEPADLAQPGLTLLLAAPGVPVRTYSDLAIIALGDAAYQAAVYANLASEEENVRLVVTKVALGEADAGIVYLSDITPDIVAQVVQIPIPDAASVAAVYPIARSAGARQPELAAAFIDFVLSVDGQAVLQRWGFAPPP